MLKRFNVTNFSSFRDEQSFDMTAGSTKVLKDHTYDFNSVKLLKSAVIYGANASGKSNLVKSIKFASDVVLNGISRVDSYKKYFRLCSDSSSKNSSFEFEIEINDKFYSYGFSLILKDKNITEEWLYEIGKNKPELIFERTNNDLKFGKTITSDTNGKARFEIYREDMANQNKQLFLSEVAEKDLTITAAKTINKIYNWFDEKLMVLFPNTKLNSINALDSDLGTFLGKYLKTFGTGVVGVKSINEDFEKVFKELPSEFKSEIEKQLETRDEVIVKESDNERQIVSIYKDENNNLKVKKLGLVHGEKAKEIFDLKDESDGTRRLIDFIPLINSFTSDYTIIIDEFDRSLHPKLTREFFNLFYKINKNKTQLIVTTHESTLLDLNFIRRDEIWFVEKDNDDSSKIYSLNKFQVRYDSKVEKAYLLGRYGAIPIIQKLLIDEDRGDD